MQKQQQSMLNREGPLRTVDVQPPFGGARVFLGTEEKIAQEEALNGNPGVTPQLNTPLVPAPPVRSDPLYQPSQPPPVPPPQPQSQPQPNSDPLSHLLADPVPQEQPLLSDNKGGSSGVSRLASSMSNLNINTAGRGATMMQHFQNTGLFPVSPRSPLKKPSGTPSANVPREKKLGDYVDEFLSQTSAIVPSLDQYGTSPKTLRKLAKLRAWKRVLDVAAQLLAAQSNATASFTVEEEMEIKLARMWGLLRLKRVGELQKEFQAMGLHPQSPSAASPKKEAGWSPTLERADEESSVPFAMRLLAAEVLPTTERGNEQVDALYQLLSDLSRHRQALEAGCTQSPLGSGPWAIESSQEAQAWQRRIRLSLVNVFVRQRHYRLALGLLEDILQELPSPDFEEAIKQVTPVEVHRCRVEVHSRIGKIFLQMGNINDAKFFFKKAEEEDAKRAKTDSEISSKSSQILLNNGLLALTQNEFGTAMQEFDAVIKLERIRQSQQEFSFDVIQSIDSLGLEPDEHLLVAAVNNYAVCALYTCNLKGAIKHIEDIIREDPVRNMWDVIVFNLSTLYDLDSENRVSQRKKRVLEQVALRFQLDDISPQSFRIS